MNVEILFILIEYTINADKMLFGFHCGKTIRLTSSIAKDKWAHRAMERRFSAFTCREVENPLPPCMK